jgi:hypothetical protein
VLLLETLSPTSQLTLLYAVFLHRDSSQTIVKTPWGALDLMSRGRWSPTAVSNPIPYWYACSCIDESAVDCSDYEDAVFLLRWGEDGVLTCLLLNSLPSTLTSLPFQTWFLVLAGGKTLEDDFHSLSNMKVYTFKPRASGSEAQALEIRLLDLDWLGTAVV